MNAPHTPGHDHVSELLGLYALDAADSDQATEVEQHVARCVSCHAELQSLIAAADALAFAPDQHQLPARVFDSVLQRVATAESPVDASPAVREREPRRARLRIWRPLPEGFALAGAACLTLALVAIGIQTMRIDDRDGQIRSARSSADVAAASFTGSSQVMPVTTSGALRTSKLELVDVHGTGMIVSKDLPEAPPGYRWRIWGVDADRQLHAVGDLDPVSEDGMAVQPVVGLHAKPYDALAITLERTDAGSSSDGPVVGWASMS